MIDDPVAGDNSCKVFCRRIVKFCESFIVKNIVYPIVIVLPPILVTSVAQTDELKKELLKYLSADSLTTVSNLVLIILATIYMVLVKAIYLGIKSYGKPSKELEKRDLIAILRGIDIVLDEKAKRMDKNAALTLASPRDCTQIFKAVTLPEQQISLLVVAIHSFFEYLSEQKVNFRVGLLRVESDKVVEWEAFHPRSSPPRTLPAKLNIPTSTVSKCIKSKSMIIINDVRKELLKEKSKRAYFEGNFQSSEQGSQLCYPIVHNSDGKIHYVLTIAGNKADSLNQSHTDLYKWVLNHYIVRISLERSLLIMKANSI